MSDKFELVSKYLVRKLKEDKNLYVLVADVWECYFFGEHKQYLDEEVLSRLINTGISEANSISVAAGLAQSGKTVVVLGLAAFLTCRAFEQLKLDVCYNNCNVKVIGIHGGVVGPKIAGYSHWAIEDIALMNALPNVSIVDIAPTDCEFYKLMDESFEMCGPVYIRMDCPYMKHVNLDYDVKFGKISKVKSGEKIAIISSGGMLKEAVDCRKKLVKLSLNPSIYSCHTIKPFDKLSINRIIDKNEVIIVFEEHVNGGLSSIIAQSIVKRGKGIKFFPMYIQNEKYNFVAATKETVFKHLYNFDELYKGLGEIQSANKLTGKNFSYKDGTLIIKYKLFNITILKLVERPFSKKGKLSYKVFLFGGIRIL